MTPTQAFTCVANVVSRYAGRPFTFLLCVAMVVVWAAFGPAFDFSETWQLVINTSTTIITFLMVFLIQNTQNRDNAAVQAKLDELIRVGDGKNDFIGIERLTDRELEDILSSFDADELKPHVKREIIEKSADKVRSRKDARADAKTSAPKPAAARKKPATKPGATKKK
jgi:low affinity Fe/Cu permease